VNVNRVGPGRQVVVRWWRGWRGWIIHVGGSRGLGRCSVECVQGLDDHIDDVVSHVPSKPFSLNQEHLAPNDMMYRNLLVPHPHFVAYASPTTSQHDRRLHPTMSCLPSHSQLATAVFSEQNVARSRAPGGKDPFGVRHDVTERTLQPKLKT
jgi:hypothetical protein